LEGQIGLSLPHSSSRRHGDDSKLLDQLSKYASVATAVFLCLVRCEVAGGQSVPTADDVSNKTDQIVLYVGISNQLARLRDLSSQPTPENSADRMWLHQDILEAVTAGSLQVDAAVAQIDFEISSVNALRGSLSSARDRIVNRLNLALLREAALERSAAGFNSRKLKHAALL
jgi:hypothetical protein